jgi:hypothetical protein
LQYHLLSSSSCVLILFLSSPPPYPSCPSYTDSFQTVTWSGLSWVNSLQLPLYALLLFGRKLTSDPFKGGLSIENGKIRLRAPPRISVLINELRRLLDVELMDLIDDPGLLIQGE